MSQLLEEIGIPFVTHSPVPLALYDMADFDVVVTLCDPNRAVCPVPPPGPYHVHWSIPGPDVSSSVDPITHMSGLRTLRDEIVRHVRKLLDDQPWTQDEKS
ncbi:hypothetical protein BFX06_05005 [Sulfobacillus thermosulfidooxidans]|nr:hypothetical protein BFX05_05245 [Sulfobacillus thermosulfidooxidans]OLZ14961.1 hypothetical protein BFX06_05005 [Sulfobacillus thermosulfidooxidans]OLZ19680.1 hypothetical protein BFX07_03205 [Sulfobacillus thermosulfidooxidans]